MKMFIWGLNAEKVENDYGGFVDWEEGFYNCPECGEPIYKTDWTEEELLKEICPICGFQEEEE